MEAPPITNSTPPAMQEALRKPNGANFHLADLHLHTPADTAFVCPDGTDLNTETGRKAFARRYIDAAQVARLSLLGITDHNSVEWVDLLREAAQDSEITIFPGFELAANSGAGGIHLVCLFEPDRPHADGG